MKQLWDLIDGHKTQISAVALLILSFCINRGWVPTDVGDLITAILAACTGGSIAHHEIKKNQVNDL